MATAVAVRFSRESGRRMPASPKSATFAWLRASTRMFSGFRSRWMMPFSCAYSMARATCRRMRRPCCGEGRFTPSSSRRERPSTYSMTK